LDAKGCVCEICEFDFEKSYGELGRQYCHVHHIKPLSELDGEIEVDPIMDLMPVCANCHSMLHRVTPALQPAELFEMIKNAKVN
jgi:5-methylcytosine-specific restriction protein A